MLAILATFPGLAHMLPSPTAVIADSAHAELYDERTWGRHPVVQAILDAARAAHTRLETTIDPERLVYVAGFDRPTPYRVRIDKPGGFSFQETRDGDGRVPHDLGLLDGVATYWVDAAHGDLARATGCSTPSAICSSAVRPTGCRPPARSRGARPAAAGCARPGPRPARSRATRRLRRSAAPRAGAAPAPGRA